MACTLQELVKTQRAVIERAGKSKTVFNERPLTRGIALVHPANLRDGHVGFIDHGEEIIRKVIQQAVRGFSLLSAVDVSRIVFDSAAEAQLLHHLKVVGGAHSNPLGLE